MRLRLHISPSFELDERWEISLDSGWDVSVPKLEWVHGWRGTSRATLDQAFVDRVRGQVAQVPAVPTGPGPIGVDGVSYSLEITHAAGALSFRWWVEPPPGCEALEGVVDLLVSEARRLETHMAIGSSATEMPGVDAMRIIAIDWSGAKRGASKHIWLAEAVDGRLTRLEAGRSREEIASDLVAELQPDSHMVVGFDFAFSLPAWFLEELGLSSAPDLWRWAEQHAERCLSECEPPFWGRPGKKKPDLPDHLRRADREVPSVGGTTPKSPFQIGGAGAVGTGTLRGLPLLAQLSTAGFNVWPFDPPDPPLIVEIYPRVLTGEVKKSSPDARTEYVNTRYPELDDRWVGLIVSSEDAFDAAVSALVMAEHTAELLDLPGGRDRQDVLEGRIWMPGV